MSKIGFCKVAEEAEVVEEVEKDVFQSFIVCPACKDEIRSDQCPQKEDKFIFCSCKNLQLGFKDSHDKASMRRGVMSGFITIRYKKDYPLFHEKK